MHRPERSEGHAQKVKLFFRLDIKDYHTFCRYKNKIPNILTLPNLYY
ncbi:MAG: hypothetical protein NZ455_07575 [Bacteroidia bacterium]|nr:hypothetical protein [Bacteroidia bacterium]MDW8346423.1 hypothetical protein [Bacteroidia bacterium]